MLSIKLCSRKSYHRASIAYLPYKNSLFSNMATLQITRVVHFYRKEALSRTAPSAEQKWCLPFVSGICQVRIARMLYVRYYRCEVTSWLVVKGTWRDWGSWQGFWSLFFYQAGQVYHKPLQELQVTRRETRYWQTNGSKPFLKMYYASVFKLG